MKIKSVMLASVGTLALATSAAFAQIDTQALVAKFQADGFTRVEVKVGPTQVKVEAIRGNTKVETIYDARTGAVLKQETEAVNAGDNTSPGVQFDNRSRDFLDDDEDSEDDESDEFDDEDDEEDDDEDDEDEDDEDDDDEDDDDEEDDED